MLQPDIMLSGEFADFEQELEAISEARKHFQKGEIILGATDERDKYCFYVLSGIILCSYISEDGHVWTSSRRGSGTIFPLYYRYKSTSIESTLEFSAATKVEVLLLPKAKIKQLVSENSEFSLSMMDAWGKYATYLLFTFESQFDSLRRRTCNFLYLHGHETGFLAATHSEISQAVGSTRENLSRVLADLQKEGIVELARGKIKILSLEKLIKETNILFVDK